MHWKMLPILWKSRCYTKPVLRVTRLMEDFSVRVSYRELRFRKRKTDTQAFLKEVIGIDLGSTYTCTAVIKEKTPDIIKDYNDYKVTPSALFFDLRGVPHFGIDAKMFINVGIAPPVSSVKRLIGRKFNDPELQKEMLRTSSHIVRAPNCEALVDIGGEKYSVVEITSIIFEELKLAAEWYLKHPVKPLVFTVPSDFSNLQKQAILKAGKKAGLDILCFMEEPLAAALAYGCGTKDEVIAVYDLGGRTFNISIYEIQNGIFKVKSQLGDNFLGGEEFDDVLGNYIMEEFKRKEGLDLLNYLISMQCFKLNVEEAKCELSDLEETTVCFPYQTGRYLHYKSVEVTREKFEHLASDLINKTIELCQKALGEAKLNAPDIQKIVLVGGMTKMPKIREMVRKFFMPAHVMCSFPDEAIAMGAAILGKALADHNSNLGNLTPLSFTKDGKFPLMITDKNLNAKTMIFFTEADQNGSVRD